MLSRYLRVSPVGGQQENCIILLPSSILIKCSNCFKLNIHLTQFAKAKQTKRKNKSPDTGEPFISTAHSTRSSGVENCVFAFFINTEFIFKPLRVKNAAVKPPSLARTRPSHEVLTRLSLFSFFILCPRLRGYIKGSAPFVSVPISGACWT